MTIHSDPPSPISLSIYRTTVQPEWIDYNQHMNDGYYAVAFGLAGGDFQDEIGMDALYRSKTQNTLYTVEAHISYLRELKVGHPIHITHQLLGVDYKRIHLFQRMFHSEEGFLAATMEVMYLHVDQAIGRSAAIPQDQLVPLEALAAEHSTLERPSQAGRSSG
ncbi:MAG: thioesterase family protein, partial [Chloroflexota bacterium]